MNTANFQNLIQKVTGRDFQIAAPETLTPGQEYQVFRVLPITGRKVCFKWKVALSEEKVLRSFITAFTTKYLEPDPLSYNSSYGKTWNERSPIEREYAYSHHRSHMFNKTELMQQVEANFSNPEMEKTLLQYGFYSTEYGTGIFCYFATESVINAINKMKDYLRRRGIPYSNEFSDARWVYRFKLNLTKELHSKILKEFN